LFVDVDVDVDVHVVVLVVVLLFVVVVVAMHRLLFVCLSVLMTSDVDAAPTHTTYENSSKLRKLTPSCKVLYIICLRIDT